MTHVFRLDSLKSPNQLVFGQTNENSSLLGFRVYKLKRGELLLFFQFRVSFLLFRGRRPNTYEMISLRVGARIYRCPLALQRQRCLVRSNLLIVGLGAAGGNAG